MKQGYTIGTKEYEDFVQAREKFRAVMRENYPSRRECASAMARIRYAVDERVREKQLNANRVYRGKAK